MRCHGAVGHDQGKSGAACGAFLVLKHCLHPRALSSMSLSIPGHHTWLRATAFMRATPGCALCGSLRTCSCKEGGMMICRPHIRQPCSTECSSLWRKNGLSSGGVQKWRGQPFWVIARAFARTRFLAVWRAISKTETGCLRTWTTDTWKILSSTLASFLYCRGSLDKASELATSADGLNSISYWYEESSRDHRWRWAAAKTGVAESGAKIFSKGLWSVRSLNLRPNRYMYSV